MAPSVPPFANGTGPIHEPVRRAPGARPLSPTSVTCSELPAARAPQSAEELLEDWGDEDSDPITDVVRLAELSAAQQLQDRAVLIRMDGALAGQVASLGIEPVSIGRHAKNVLSIADGGVSRFHARILAYGRGHVIEDLGSRNGTFVRGQRLSTEAELRDGDWVQLGPRVTLRYSLTDLRQEDLLRQLYESSTRDALTGAYNRQHFDERLNTEIAYANRHATNVSLVMFDIDHFKRINDTHGHQCGDQVLRHVSRLAARQLRAEDVFARYGGEEFAVILRGIDLLGSVRAAERLRSTIEVLPAGYQKSIVPATISAGCAALAECPRRDGETLLALADARLYAAKRAGRNRIVSSR